MEAKYDTARDKYFGKFDELDQERIRHMRAAENFAGLPTTNGIHEWSPLLENTGRAVTYWKLRLNLPRDKTYTSDRLESAIRRFH